MGDYKLRALGLTIINKSKYKGLTGRVNSRQ